jgi:hypothetical protein
VLYVRDNAVSRFAVVDSGASTSSFPRSVAQALGIGDHELEPTRYGVNTPGGSTGKAVPSWRPNAEIDIHGQILARSSRYDAEAFGPRFRLDPVFIEDESWFVLGRDDFFRAFSVTFPKPKGSATPKFVLDF